MPSLLVLVVVVVSIRGKRDDNVGFENGILVLVLVFILALALALVPVSILVLGC